MATRTDTGRQATSLAVAAIAFVTLWRVLWLAADGTTLSTDEAQYWFWGQEFAFGAYSKPPLIGWLIRAATEIAGQSVFGVRVAAPVFHGATALIILVLARRFCAPRVAAFAALSYVTLPAVALGSALITTDTPLLFFAAAALLFQHKLAESGKPWLILGLGAAVGLGFLSKYAMIYVVLGMVAAAVASAEWRMSWRAFLAVGVIAFAVLLPNLLWISTHRFVTFQHVASDAEWQGLTLYPMQALRFVAEQFAVFGPVLFLAWLAALTRFAGQSRTRKSLFLASALPLAVVVIQAITSRALANWGVTFVVAGVIVAAIVLARRPVLMAVSLSLALIVSLGLPVVMALGTGWRMPDGRLALRRYLGQPDIIEWAGQQARAGGATAIIANQRDLLAGLSWAARNSGLAVQAPPGDGPPANHWDLLHQADPAQPGPVYLLAVAGTDFARLCPEGQTSERIAGPGYLEGQAFVLRRVDSPSCLKQGQLK